MNVNEKSFQKMFLIDIHFLRKYTLIFRLNLCTKLAIHKSLGLVLIEEDARFE